MDYICCRCSSDSSSDHDVEEEAQKHHAVNKIGSHSASAKAVKRPNRGFQNKKSPKPNYTHFISLPLAIYPDLVDKLTHFQTSVLADYDCQDLGIDRSIFNRPKTFHLTVLMLELGSDERVVKATKVLQRVSSKVVDALGNKPVYVRLKGLGCMRGTFAKAYVLHTPVEVIGGEDRLLRACQIITEACAEAGLVLEEDARKKLKLHGTVMNANYRKRTNSTERSKPFDARGIEKQYGSKDWGKYLIREAHLSQRSAFDANGYFHCCASIAFPKGGRS